MMEYIVRVRKLTEAEIRRHLQGREVRTLVSGTALAAGSPRQRDVRRGVNGETLPETRVRYRAHLGYRYRSCRRVGKV